MNRREIRETIIKLIYQDIIGGDFFEEDYPTEVVEIYKDVKAVYPEIDQIISDNLTSWSITRLNYVDLAIIRFAVYEMKYLKLASEIAINEALEITKKYSNLDDDLARKFNNRLLDNIRISLEKENG
jgi:N utilization substance protein B